eukprot:776142-Rhodomonas_salina.2
MAARKMVSLSIFERLDKEGLALAGKQVEELEDKAPTLDESSWNRGELGVGQTSCRTNESGRNLSQSVSHEF